jgi:nucleoside-diphosphate-sugar epimerase
MTPRVLVTGANGVVGSAVVKHLLSFNIEAVALQDETGIRTDLRSINAKTHPIQDVDFIVHCAAPIPGKNSSAYPARIEKDIDQIDLNVMKLAKRFHSRVFYLSTCGLYVRTHNDFLSEEQDLAPRSPYFLAKQRGESRFLNHTNAVVLRISSPFGEKIHPTAVLAKYLDGFQRNANLDLWGSGAREQDYVCTEDIANFVYKQIMKWTSGVFNVVSGNPITMLELARLIVSNSNSEICFTGLEDPEEGLYSRFSALKANGLLDWEATISIRSWIEVAKLKGSSLWMK